MSRHLLIIDPQNDFCDLPDTLCPPATGERPSLPVPGAHADMLRIAALIDRAGPALDAITVTLDAHHRIDIAHPAFWCGPDQAPPPPFTTVDAADVREGRWRPRDPHALARVIAYLDALAAAGRYAHTIWPVHCEIGSWGHAVHHAVRAAYNRWEVDTLRSVTKVLKGSNPWTEHYSAVRAEVPDPDDPATGTNASLVAALRHDDAVYIAGEAASHCVRATTEHLVEQLGADAGRLTLLTDCMSPVPGFEAARDDFIAAMRARGLRTLTAAEAIDELLTREGQPA